MQNLAVSSHQVTHSGKVMVPHLSVGCYGTGDTLPVPIVPTEKRGCCGDPTLADSPTLVCLIGFPDQGC